MSQAPTIPPAPRATRYHYCDPRGFDFGPEDAELVRTRLGGFVPDDVFDAHAHLYDLRMLGLANDLLPSDDRCGVGLQEYDQCLPRWLNGRSPRQGLFFAFPAKSLDTRQANRFLHAQVRGRPGSAGLLMIRPGEDPAAVDAQVAAEGWAGFKVYHLFGDRPDTQDCLIGEFLPDWAWEIADRRQLAIMLHLVRQRSLADPENQVYIREYCRRYPGANLILAHAARGFCGAHTAEGIAAVGGLDNLYFDTSVVCESWPLEAILREYGASRLLFGTDFPVSEVHGKAITLGDGFYWIYRESVDWSTWRMGHPTLVGMESLFAIQQACRTLRLTDADVQRIFAGNAREILARAGC